MKKVIISNKAPGAVGPYSQAIEANGFVFCSGQIGINPATGELVNGLKKQTTQVMKNLKAVLKEAGCKFEDVVRTDIFITDLKGYLEVNEIYGSFFDNEPPARATVEVSALPKDALVEISCIAVKNG